MINCEIFTWFGDDPDIWIVNLTDISGYYRKNVQVHKSRVQLVGKTVSDLTRYEKEKVWVPLKSCWSSFKYFTSPVSTCTCLL